MCNLSTTTPCRTTLPARAPGFGQQLDRAVDQQDTIFARCGQQEVGHVLLQFADHRGGEDREVVIDVLQLYLDHGAGAESSL